MKKILTIMAVFTAVSLYNCDVVDDLAEAAGIEKEAVGTCGFDFTYNPGSGDVTFAGCLQDADKEYLPGASTAASGAHTTQCSVFEALADNTNAAGDSDTECPTTNVVGTCSYTISVSEVSYDYELVVYGGTDLATEADDAVKTAAALAGEGFCLGLSLGVTATWTAAN